MALADRDINLARRGSKSSAYSASIKDTLPFSSPSGNPDAVLSMLKTTTETGDIGSFSATPSRFPRLPAALARRPKHDKLTASSSRASSHYSRAGSVRSAKSQQSAAASDAGAPYNNRRFAASQDFSPVNPTTSTSLDRDRSYSLTQEPPYPRNLGDNRSLSSIKSQGWNARPRSPFVMANRLNSSGYRPVSPALSDNSAMYGRRLPPQHRPPPGPRPYPMNHAARYHHDTVAMSPMPPLMTPPIGPRMRPTRAFEDLQRPFQSVPTYEPPVDYYHRPPPPRHVDYGGPPLGQYAYSNAPPQAHRDAGTPPPNVNAYSGFVRRVKNVLEERISTDETRSPTGSVRRPRSLTVMDPDRTAPLSVVNDSNQEHSSSNASQAADETASLAQLQEGEEHAMDAPDTVQGSADADPDEPSIKRLTRDLIKAGMDGMSDIAELSDIGIDPPLDSSLDYEPRVSGHPSQLWKGEATAEIPGAFPSTPAPEEPRVLVQSSIDEQHGESAKASTFAIPIPPKDERRNSTNFDFRRSMLRAGGTDGQLEPESERAYQKQDDHTRPFSMPQSELAADSRAQKTTAFKSMPPSSHSRVSTSTTMLDSDSEDDQKAIRLSSIQPPEEKPRAVSDSVSSAQTSEAEISAKSRRSSSVPTPSPELVSQTITVSPPTTLVPATAARNSVRLSTGADGGRTIPSASRSGALSLDQRASAIRNFNAPLPDLTEDSQEDASTTNLRMLGMKAPMFRQRQMREHRPSSRLSSEAPPAGVVVHPTHGIPASVAPLPPSSYVGAKFADTRNIPSFNFSRVDLTTKLNKALGYRLSRSFEDFTQGSIRTGDISNEDRPMSSNMARERYRSFFVFDESSEEGEDIQQIEDQVADQIADNTLKSTTRSLAIDQHILNEIDRLSIPSVKHLTSRLSELLPNIKQSQTEGDLNKVDEALKDTLTELRALGAAEKAVATEAAEGLRGGGTISKRDRPVHLDKKLPPLPDDDGDVTSDQDGQEGSSGDDSLETAPEHTTGDHQCREESEPEGTAVDNTLTTMLDDNTKNIELSETPPGVPSSEALRQEATPRPWNNQENYPWTNKTPPIKLKPKPSSGDVESSAEELNAQEALHVVRSMSPGFNDPNLVPVASAEADKEAPSSSKKGLLKSLTQIVGLKSKSSRSGPSIDPHFLHPEESALSQTPSQTSSRRVDQGDRYPTTSLIAPDGMQVEAPVDDGNRSFFSNDSSISDHQGGGGFRKRFTRFRASRSNAQMEPVRRQASGNESQREVHQEVIGSQPAVNVDDQPQQANHEPLPGGMSKTEYRAKRLVEKLRYLIYKSGERLKNLTTPSKKRSRFWYETNVSENMLYSH